MDASDMRNKHHVQPLLTWSTNADHPVSLDQKPLQVPGPPLELKMNNRTSTALQMSWNEPLEKNGILVNYKVEVVAVESFLESHMGWNSSETVLLDSYTVTGLHPASQYNISVRASTSVGYGPATTILAYTINDGNWVLISQGHKTDCKPPYTTSQVSNQIIYISLHIAH
ncbi:PTPRK [Cordylochernes scorpioides]|uniref:PTPRK n=1 Tax=Cordylochernes scorpioides TaxID=51811 RepID=A0ABY6KYR8_9ARAC|nr:PTPRK [Cordylochernes scorpioides]